MSISSFLMPFQRLLAAPSPVYPGATWESRSPEELGLDPAKLDALRALVQGRGCVARHGYMAYTWGDQRKSSDVASAMKPVVSTLLLMAMQEGKLSGPDDLVVNFEPRLRTINGGKDAAITWRHLASQTSGYGLEEKPGTAYSYNDFALAFYYDTLMQKVFQQPGTEVLKTHLAQPLQFEDHYTFEAFSPHNRPGRLALSVRDFARFGLLYLRHGRWQDRQVLKPDLVEMAIRSPLSSDTPLTSGREAEMLPNQRSIGGSRNITPVGPGYYSFNWWINGTNKLGQRLYVEAPPDTYVASGHGGMRACWIIPSLDLIVSWNDSPIEDHDASPGNPKTKSNQAARLMREAVIDPGQTNITRTRLGIQGSQFTINNRPTFLHGISYYGALGISDENLHQDLDDMQRYGLNWMRVWATWTAFENDVSAVNADGTPREPFLRKLQHLVRECDRRGVLVDVTLSRGHSVNGQEALITPETQRLAVKTIVQALKPFANWYLDLSNERNIRDKRFTSSNDLKALRALVRKLDPDRLVTASYGTDLSREDLRKDLQVVKVDFIAPHRPRQPGSAEETAAKNRQYLAWMKALGRVVPVHYQEPFRRGYGQWNPQAKDFIADARAAKAGGAAGWCLHNGGERKHPEGRPRRSFDMREKRLFDQLDNEEIKAIESLKDLTQ